MPRKFKKIMAILLVAVLAFGLVPQEVFAEEVGNADVLNSGEISALGAYSADEYDAMDVEVINNTIRSNAGLPDLGYKENEPQNWDFITWGWSSPVPLDETPPPRKAMTIDLQDKNLGGNLTINNLTSTIQRNILLNGNSFSSLDMTGSLNVYLSCDSKLNRFILPSGKIVEVAGPIIGGKAYFEVSGSGNGFGIISYATAEDGYVFHGWEIPEYTIYQDYYNSSPNTNFIAKSDTDATITCLFVPTFEGKYHLDDVNAINDLIQHHGLEKEGYKINDPENWNFVLWDKRFNDDNLTLLDPVNRAYGLNLSYLDLSGTLDVSQISQLQRLFCNNNQLTELNVSGLKRLEILSCRENRLEELDLTGLMKLKEMSAAKNPIRKFTWNNGEVISLSFDVTDEMFYNNKVDKMFGFSVVYKADVYSMKGWQPNSYGRSVDSNLADFKIIMYQDYDSNYTYGLSGWLLSGISAEMIPNGSNEMNFYMGIPQNDIKITPQITDRVAYNVEFFYYDELGEYVGFDEWNKSALFGDTFGALPVPSRKGYIFDGWCNWNTGERITESSIVKSTWGYYIYCEANWLPISCADEQTGISIQAKDGTAFDAGSTLQSIEVQKGEDYNFILQTMEGAVSIFDISLLVNGVETQPRSKVTVSIPIPLGLKTNNLKVYRIEAGGAKTDMNAKVGGGYIIFETDHFSLYVIAQSSVAKGDVNSDGSINIQDIMMIRNHIFGKALLEGDSFLAADLNGDDSINIQDIMAIRNHIFGKVLIE